MKVTQEEWSRIVELRRNWAPREEGEELCVVGAAVETRRVRQPEGDDGVAYYRCGGGRRVIRKKIGGD
jgi:hypothetical protein